MTTHLPERIDIRRRPNGKVDFFYRLRGERPEGWPKLIRLPMAEADRRRDGSPEELAAVARDAAALTHKLAASVTAGPPRGSLPWAMAQWRASRSWAALKPKSVTFYEQGWSHVERWSTKNGDPHMQRIGWPVIIRLMEVYADRPGVHRQVRTTLQALFRVAVDEGVVTVNPFRGNERYRWSLAKTKRQKRTVTWSDVVEIVRLCDAAGYPSMGTAAMLAFDTMQYPIDIIAMRFGEHYDAAAGLFRFDREKTGVPAETPASDALRARIGAADRLFVLLYEGTGQPYSRDHFTKVWRACIAGSRFDGLEFRHLRHSAVNEADEAGADDHMIDAMGAWKPGGSGKAVRDAHYRALNSRLAREGMELRERLRRSRVASDS